MPKAQPGRDAKGRFVEGSKESAYWGKVGGKATQKKRRRTHRQKSDEEGNN